MSSGVTVAIAGDDFSDVSAAFAAQFSTVNEHLNTADIAFDKAIAANHEMSVIEGKTEITFDAYVSAVDGITIDTVDDSINAAVSEYKNALAAYNTSLDTRDDWTSSATFSSVDLATTEVERLREVLSNFKTSVDVLGSERIFTQADVEGVTQIQVDAASYLVDLGTGFDYAATELLAVETVASTDEGIDAIPDENIDAILGIDSVDVPVTAEVVGNLKRSFNSEAYAEGALYEDSPAVHLTLAQVEAIKAAHKANTKIAFYDDPDGNNGEEITSDRITAAEALRDAGPIVDVTLADIAKAEALISADVISQVDIDAASDLVFAGAINQIQIDAAANTAKRDVVTVKQFEDADNFINEIVVVTVEDNVSVNDFGNGDGANILKLLTVNENLVTGVNINEENAIEASALIDNNDTDWAEAYIKSILVTEAQAQKVVEVYENQQIVNDGSITQEEIDAAIVTAARDVATDQNVLDAIVTAARTEVTDEMMADAKALKKAGIINVLTQAEFDAAKTFVSEMAGVETAIEAMEAAEADLIEAIKNSDDKAIKAASKALESATAKINNAISINLKVVDAIEAVNNGKMSIKHFNEKINPDVGVALSGAMSGVTVVNNTITSHQNTIVASSGKYGLSKHSGVNAGNPSLNMGVWLKAFGSDSEMDMRDGVAGYDADAHGIVIGIDQIVSSDFMVGIALSFADIDVEGKSTARSITDTDQIQGTLYGTLYMNDFFINGSMAYAHSSSATERTGFGVPVTGEYDTSTYSASVGAGMPIDMELYAITPQVTLAYSHINPDEYTETGFGALNVSPESMDLFGIKAGVTLNKKLVFDGGTLSPKLRLIADWDVLQEKAQVNSSWVSTGTTVAPTSGPEPAALGGIIGAGIDYSTDDGVYVLSFDYDLSTRSDFVSHAASAQFRMNF